MKRTYGRTIAVLCLVMSTGMACRVQSNGRLALGEDLHLAGTNPSMMQAGLEEQAIPAAGSPLRPRSVTLDRSMWQRREVVVPYDGIRHIPSYTTQWTPRYDHRSTGRAPTLMSVLELGDADYDMGVMEGVGNGAVALLDAVMIVPRALAWDFFWKRNQSPQWPYERRASSPWLALSVAPEAPEQAHSGTVQRTSEPEAEQTEPPDTPAFPEESGDEASRADSPDDTDEHHPENDPADEVQDEPAPSATNPDGAAPPDDENGSEDEGAREESS